MLTSGFEGSTKWGKGPENRGPGTCSKPGLAPGWEEEASLQAREVHLRAASRAAHTQAQQDRKRRDARRERWPRRPRLCWALEGDPASPGGTCTQSPIGVKTAIPKAMVKSILALTSSGTQGPYAHLHPGSGLQMTQGSVVAATCHPVHAFFPFRDATFSGRLL